MQQYLKKLKHEINVFSKTLDSTDLVPDKIRNSLKNKKKSVKRLQKSPSKISKSYENTTKRMSPKFNPVKEGKI